jgi:hypothetical protein
MTMPQTRHPWHIFYPLGGLLVLCLAWSAYWTVAFGAAREFVDAKRDALMADGVRLACASESWGGFPFRFEFTCESPVLSYAKGSVVMHVQSAHVVALVQAYNPRHALVLVDGPTRLAQDAGPSSEISHERALLSMSVNPEGRWELSSDVADVQVDGLFTSASLRFFARQSAGKLDLAGSAEGVIIEGPDHATTAINAAEFTASTSAAMVASGQPLAYAAATGEAIVINSFKISHSAMKFDAQGNIRLDADKKLAGKLTTSTNDIDGLLDVLAPIFKIKRKDRGTVNNLLNLVGNDPGSAIKRADFIAKNGEIYWGPFKLADVGTIN